MATTAFTASADGADPGVAVLEWARQLTGPALRRWTELLPPAVAGWAGYHLGLQDETGRPPRGYRGKAVRPALVLSCAEAAGGAARDAVRAAVTVELVHNFSLLHDDVIDQDALRRHRPTVWKLFGVPAAILTGDARLALAHRVLATAPGPRTADSIAMLGHAVEGLVEGEAMDVAFERRPEVTTAEYAAMATAKTGALTGAACGLGALAGGADVERARFFTKFGRHLGLAFQIVDDLLGIIGDPGTTGKPVGGDLAARKKTYPVIAALASDTEQGRTLAGMYASGAPLSDADLRWAALLVTDAGGVRAARSAVDQELEAAFAALAEADPAPEARRDLMALARVLTHRDD
ncbi:polyprenyl synthetase family protein [Streptomyces sp. NPDC050617]|uniref:polyprenyl synthetase family protein n=1 Tax=Streptomyces sp. NPDC050617 TaxID=3154628 RepID=UPI00342FD794